MAGKRDDQRRIERALAPDDGLTSEEMDTNSIVKSVSADKIAGKAGGAVFGRESQVAAGAGESLVALDNPDDVDTYLSSGGDGSSVAHRNPGGNRVPGGKAGRDRRDSPGA